MATIPNLHTGRKLFLYEKISLRGGTADRFVDGFASSYQPVMEKVGARLFGIWESATINARWSGVTVVWEVDSYRHLSAIAASQHTNLDVRKSHQQWLGLLGEIDAHGESRLVFGNNGIKTVAERKAENFRTTVVLEEIMTTKPNRQAQYVEELEYLYVPWSEDTGKKWVGSFTTVFRYDEVIHLWAMDGGWGVFANHFPSWTNPPDPRIRSWMNVAPALRDGWEDSLLQALPPNPLS